MKLKDLKPGMKVALGTMSQVHGKYGSWEYTGREAYVVDIGGYYIFGSYHKKLAHSPEKRKQVLVAVKGWDGKSWTPDIVGGNGILMPWDDYQKKVDEERKEKARLKKVQEEGKKKRFAKFKALHKRASDMDVTISQSEYSVLINFENLEKLLDLAEAGYRTGSLAAFIEGKKS